MQGLGNVQEQQQEAAPFTFETAVKLSDGFIKKANLDMKKAGLGKIDKEAITAVKTGKIHPDLVFQSDRVSEGAKDILSSDLGLA